MEVFMINDLNLDDLLKTKNAGGLNCLPSFLRIAILRVLSRIEYLPRINRFLRAHGITKGVGLVDDVSCTMTRREHIDDCT